MLTGFINFALDLLVTIVNFSSISSWAATLGYLTGTLVVGIIGYLIFRYAEKIQIDKTKKVKQ
jgi:hypothetical protein